MVCWGRNCCCGDCADGKGELELELLAGPVRLLRAKGLVPWRFSGEDTAGELAKDEFEAPVGIETWRKGLVDCGNC